MPYKAPGSGREGSCVFLIAPDGSLLLQQRDDDVPPAGVGRWTPPGGGRENGEDPRQTALREFEEETGVRLERLRFFESVTTREVPELLPSSLHVFFADDVVARDRIAVNEGLDFQYHHPDTFAELPMNPGTRNLLARFLASDAYRGTVAMAAPWKAGVGVIQLDRWGRALLQLRDADLPAERFPNMWSIPGGLMDHEEAPDAAAVREFEEETGALLEELSLFRVYRSSEIPGSLTDLYHVYFVDADLEEEFIDVREGQAFRYFTPAETSGLAVPPPIRQVLDEFFASTAYRRLFH
jgi:8-oxo-dGTP pyrophosphatase MutT (NUDIX family)